MTEQLAGPVAAAHGDHHFAAPLLGQGVEAAHHDGVVVDDDDLLVGDAYLYHVVDDGAQCGEGFGEVLFCWSVSFGARTNTVTLTPRPTAAWSSVRRVRTRDATQADHSQIELWA